MSFISNVDLGRDDRVRKQGYQPIHVPLGDLFEDLATPASMAYFVLEQEPTRIVGTIEGAPPKLRPDRTLN